MSNTPVHTGPVALPVERRLHVRQQVHGLTYLDIGDDNGGFVLNLSEDGMAFQTVGPLESQTRVTLRIQVLNSQTQIEAAALVVWVSKSKRQAGVRFVDMVPEVRSRICEWIGSEISSSAFSGRAPQPQETVNERQRKQRVILEPPRPESLNLTAKSGELDSASRALPRRSVSPVPDGLKKMPARKWAGVGVLVLVFSTLTFGVKRWVGWLRMHIDNAPIPKATAITTSVNEPHTVERVRRNPVDPAPRSRNTGGRLALSNRKPARLTASPSVPKQQSVPRIPIKENPTPSTATMSLETESAPAVLPDDSANVVPTQEIAAGQVLRPTDRFNPCHLTYHVEPAYPAEALKQRIEGVVKIHLVVAADGTVSRIKVLSGSPLLAPAAMDAAKYWRYLPALVNGQPVETEQDVEIDFRLPRTKPNGS